MLGTCKTEFLMILSILFSYLALEGLHVCIFTAGFWVFLRRREINKVVFGSAESIQEAGLSLWESREINFLLLPGESVMSFLNKKKYVIDHK